MKQKHPDDDFISNNKSMAKTSAGFSTDVNSRSIEKEKK